MRRWYFVMLEEFEKIATHGATVTKYFDYIEKYKFAISSIGVCCLTIANAIRCFVVYFYNYGYFSYFGMDDSYFLNTESNSLMFLVNCILTVMLIVGYFYTAIKTLKNSISFVWKCCYCLVLPILVEGISLIIMGLDFYTIDFVAWLIVFGIVYVILFLFMAWNTPKEAWNLLIANACDKHEVKEIVNPFIAKIVVLVIFACLMGGYSFYIGFDFAKRQNTFNIVTVENNTYAVIKSDGNNMVLKKCEIDDNVIVIYSNSYLKAKNDKEITVTAFQNVLCK